MGICLETTSTKDLKRLINTINEEIEKREKQNQHYADVIFGLVDDIRCEEDCTITFKNAYNEFQIGPDDDFYILVNSCGNDEDEDE